MWLLSYFSEEENGPGCVSPGQGSVGGQDVHSDGLLHPESGSSNSLSAVSFLPGFPGVQAPWETVAEGRCRPKSRAE